MQIGNDVERVRGLQLGHGEWTGAMEAVCTTSAKGNNVLEGNTTLGKIAGSEYTFRHTAENAADLLLVVHFSGLVKVVNSLIKLQQVC